jgi:hypothetical protein
LITVESTCSKRALWTYSITDIGSLIVIRRLSAEEKDYWLGHCGWCNREIGDEDERIGLNARFRDEKYYRENEGMMVSFAFTDAGRTVVAYVVTRDSPAKKEARTSFSRFVATVAVSN